MEKIRYGILFLALVILIFTIVTALQTLKYQRSKKDVYVDRLTKIYNKNYLLDYEPYMNLHDYIICAIDIDHFKKINDTYGHVIGDEVLIMATRLLQASLRQSDLLYRYGGEEFIAIIAANDLESATQAFERARLKVEQFQFPQVGHITISGGFSNADTGVLPQEVINRADRSLYAAKAAGRNRVFHYDTLVKEGVLKDAPSGSIDLF